MNAAAEQAEESTGGESLRRRAAWLSLAVAILLLATKTAAYLWTGSTAVLSDALESTVNLAAALFLVYIIRLSAKPADEDAGKALTGKPRVLIVDVSPGVVKIR